MQHRWVEKLWSFGATQEQVMAAMSSGAMGIKTFYDKLIAAANQKGMTRLGEADIELLSWVCLKCSR